ncbi:MAG: PD-(D/E)XK nuclease family protein [Phycisphaerales bacterium]
MPRRNTTAPTTSLTNDALAPISDAGYEPPHLSWSQMQAWLHCPRAYQFRYALEAEPEFTPQPLALGVAVHAALAHHYRTAMASSDGPVAGPQPSNGAAPAPTVPTTLTDSTNATASNPSTDATTPTSAPPTAATPSTPSRDSLYELISASLSAHEPPIELDEGQSLDTIAQQALTLALAVIESPAGKPRGRVVAVEEPLSGPLDESLPPFHAYVDLVTLEPASERWPRGVLTLHDFKTTRSAWGPGQVREHAGQLALYKGLVAGGTTGNATSGPEVRLEFVTVTKAKTPRVEQVPVDDRDAPLDSVLDQARAIVAGLRAGCFPARPGWGCASCPYQSRCPHAAV